MCRASKMSLPFGVSMPAVKYSPVAIGVKNSVEILTPQSARSSQFLKKPFFVSLYVIISIKIDSDTHS